MRRRIANGLILLLLMFSILAGARQKPMTLESGNTQTKQKNNSEKTAQGLRGKISQVGTASWYGKKYEGKTTASGERFDMHHFTAAHPTLPFGTYVRVTNLQNGRAVIVRINDRGPVTQDRIIDLSYNAALALDFTSEGVQRVRVDFQEHAPTQMR
jgi:rare lipoprotein A